MGNTEASSSSSEGGGQKLEYGYQTANPKSYSLIKENGKRMKKIPTEAEALLWEYLRNKSIGHKIRRQHVIGNFIVDFVCLRKKVVIEVDGKIHDQQKESDGIRTELLNELGFEVIRFTNQEILKDLEFVTKKIKNYIDNSSASQFSPPLEG